MPKLHFSRDDDGTARASGEDKRLATFLESDIQDSVEITDHLLSLLQLPQEAEFNGNSHSLNIDPKTVCISNQLDDSAIDRRLSREDFAQALESWKVFITLKK